MLDQPRHRPADMVGNLGLKAATRCRAEARDLHAWPGGQLTIGSAE
jgi:hypothetical protein